MCDSNAYEHIGAVRKTESVPGGHLIGGTQSVPVPVPVPQDKKWTTSNNGGRLLVPVSHRLFLLPLEPGANILWRSWPASAVWAAAPSRWRQIVPSMFRNYGVKIRKRTRFANFRGYLRLRDHILAVLSSHSTSSTVLLSRIPHR